MNEGKGGHWCALSRAAATEKLVTRLSKVQCKVWVWLSVVGVEEAIKGRYQALTRFRLLQVSYCRDDGSEVSHPNWLTFVTSHTILSGPKRVQENSLLLERRTLPNSISGCSILSVHSPLVL